MSRPQKIHRPIKGDFNAILGAVAMGSGAGKRAVLGLAKLKRSKTKSGTPATPREGKP